MLSALLAAHSRISCGPETHFFRWLAEQDVEALVDANHWPDRAIEFVCTISRTAFSGEGRTRLIDSYGVGRGEIAKYLGSQQPSVGAMLTSVTKPYATALGKVRWAEKTPDHLPHVTTIRRYYPSAPIIRIVRDPRDVARSMVRMPWGVGSFLEGLMLWKRLDAASAPFFSSDGNSYTLRYEDLIGSPDQELRRLCVFVGEEFESSMLQTADTGSRLNSRNVPWKADASKPIDPSRIAMWQGSLSEDENCLAEAVLGNLLTTYGYPTRHSFRHFAEIVPAEFDSGKYEGGLSKIAMDGVRFWREDVAEQQSAYVYLGDPGGDGWVKGGRLERAVDTFSLSAKILNTRLSGRSLYWLSVDQLAPRSLSMPAVLRGLLQPYRVS